MNYRPVPQFNTSGVLSATAVNELSRLISDLYGRSSSVSVPQLLISGTHVGGTGTDQTLVTKRLSVHRCLTPSSPAEYLYYDVLFTGTSAARCYIYAVDCNPATATPVATLSPSATRQRALIAASTWAPSPGHPADEAQMEVSVYIQRNTDETCTATVYALQVISYPAAYVAMDDATALTDTDTAAGIPVNLQKVATAVAALDGIAVADVPMFRSEQVIARTSEPKTLGPWVFNYFDAGRLYYHLYVDIDEPTTQTVTLQWKINSVNVGAALTWTYDECNGMNGLAVEGFLTLGAYEVQERLRVEADVTMDAGGANAPGRVRLDYLAERPSATKPASWVWMAGVEHLDTVELDSPPMTIGQGLRDFWTNTIYLAGDSGTGYGSDGYDVGGDCNYPVGHAMVACRNALVQTGAKPRVQNDVVVRYSIVDIPSFDAGRVSYHKYQQACFLRSRDWLYHRTKGASIVFVGEDGNESEQSLSDYDDDNDYQVFGLAGPRGLNYSTLYYIRVPMADDDEYVLDYAYERV